MRAHTVIGNDLDAIVLPYADTTMGSPSVTEDVQENLENYTDE